MGLGLILDDLCVFIGMVVVWFAKGRKGDLRQELSTFKFGGLYTGRLTEGIVGFGTLVVIAGLIWAGVHFL